MPRVPRVVQCLTQPEWPPLRGWMCVCVYVCMYLEQTEGLIFRKLFCQRGSDKWSIPVCRWRKLVCGGGVVVWWRWWRVGKSSGKRGGMCVRPTRHTTEDRTSFLPPPWLATFSPIRCLSAASLIVLRFTGEPISLRRG